MPPTVSASMGLAARALAREPWLVPVGAVVAGARRVATWPAVAVLVVLALRGARSGVAARPFDPAAAAEGALAALLAPRSLCLLVGLWLAGVLVAGALRVAWLAGALPTLGAAMAGSGGPLFARGVAYGFPHVLAASALALVAELAGALLSTALVLVAILLSAHGLAVGGSPLHAGAAALALTVAVGLPLAVGALADAAVVRAALRGEGPGRAFAEGARRLAERPAAVLLAALAFGAAGWILPASVEWVGRLATGFARGADPIVLLGPQLMLAVGALFMAAALDLLWLATVAALACGSPAPVPGWRASAPALR